MEVDGKSPTINIELRVDYCHVALLGLLKYDCGISNQFNSRREKNIQVERSLDIKDTVLALVSNGHTKGSMGSLKISI